MAANWRSKYADFISKTTLKAIAISLPEDFRKAAVHQANIFTTYYSDQIQAVQDYWKDLTKPKKLTDIHMITDMLYQYAVFKEQKVSDDIITSLEARLKYASSKHVESSRCSETGIRAAFGQPVGSTFTVPSNVLLSLQLALRKETAFYGDWNFAATKAVAEAAAETVMDVSPDRGTTKFQTFYSQFNRFEEKETRGMAVIESHHPDVDRAISLSYITNFVSRGAKKIRSRVFYSVPGVMQLAWNEICKKRFSDLHSMNDSDSSMALQGSGTKLDFRTLHTVQYYPFSSLLGFVEATESWDLSGNQFSGGSVDILSRADEISSSKRVVCRNLVGYVAAMLDYNPQDIASRNSGAFNVPHDAHDVVKQWCNGKEDLLNAAHRSLPDLPDDAVRDVLKTMRIVLGYVYNCDPSSTGWLLGLPNEVVVCLVAHVMSSEFLTGIMPNPTSPEKRVDQIDRGQNQVLLETTRCALLLGGKWWMYWQQTPQMTFQSLLKGGNAPLALAALFNVLLFRTWFPAVIIDAKQETATYCNFSRKP